MHPWAVLLAIPLILVILWDAFETIVLSRRVSRTFRLTRLFYRLLWRPWRSVARLFPAGNRRENVLMVFGPLSLILLLATWAVGLILAFALLHWGLGSRMATVDESRGFLVDLYMSGTTFVTLGLGDVTPRNTLARSLTVLESGMGFAFLALVIGYLPMISQAFSRREVNISLLDARAGSPPTAAQLLRRHSCENADDLGDLLRQWERWSAELLESHVSFPVLSYFRSQHDNQSWVAALTAILDACTLVIARVEDGPVRTARLTFAIARHAVVDLCAVFSLPPRPPSPERLPPEKLEHLAHFLAKADVRLKEDEGAMSKFSALRALYEPQVEALSRFLLMPLPDWVPSAESSDNWERTGAVHLGGRGSGPLHSGSH
jgi:Ion channel